MQKTQDIEQTTKSTKQLEVLNEEEDIDMSFIISKSETLHKKFTNELPVQDENFTLGSVIFYLSATLNIDVANANVYGMDATIHTHYINLGETYSFTESSLKSYFTSLKNLVVNDLALSVISDKGVKYVSIFYDESTGERLLIAKVLIGHKNYADEWDNLAPSAFTYFAPTVSYCYNNNGGSCVDPYFAPLDWGLKRFWDIHGAQRGYDYGGATELEKAINISYNYEFTRRMGNSSFAYPVGKKPVFMAYGVYKTIKPSDEINAQNNVSPNHNKTNIFSYNNWTSNLHNTLPCITGAELDFYLEQAIDKILFNSNYTPTASKVFVDCQVRSRYKRYDGVTFPVPLQEVRVAQFNVGNTTVDEYFGHVYDLVSAKVVLVVDPDAR